MARVVFEFWPHGLESCGSTTGQLVEIVQSRGWLLWLLDGNAKPKEVLASDLLVLSKTEYTPASERHGDIVALAPSDRLAIKHMRALGKPGK